MFVLFCCAVFSCVYVFLFVLCINRALSQEVCSFHTPESVSFNQYLTCSFFPQDDNCRRIPRQQQQPSPITSPTQFFTLYQCLLISFFSSRHLLCLFALLSHSESPLYTLLFFSLAQTIHSQSSAANLFFFFPVFVHCSPVFYPAFSFFRFSFSGCSVFEETLELLPYDVFVFCFCA